MGKARLFGRGFASKLLSIVLSITLVVSFLPTTAITTAYADETSSTPAVNSPPTEQVQTGEEQDQSAQDTQSAVSNEAQDQQASAKDASSANAANEINAAENASEANSANEANEAKNANEASGSAYAWYGDGSATSYTISNATELAEFANIVNGTTGESGPAKDNFAGKTVTLSADIALAADGLYTSKADVVYGASGYPMHATQYVVNADAARWTPIGSGTATSNTDATTTNAFAGTFDGNGKTISGLYIGDGTATTANSNTVAGLFGVVSGTVKNVTVSGCITAKMVAGGIVAHLNGGTVENCTNKAIVFADGGTTPAGGKEDGVKRGGAIGGIVGNAMTNSSITKCTNKGEVICTNTCKGGRVGGILGLIDNASYTVTLSQNQNSGAIVAYQYAGGILGYNESTSAPITSCSNTGTITGASSGSTYVGGIVAQTASDISECYNTGTIEIRAWSGTKGAHFGGIVSDFKGSTISNCYDTGACKYYCSGTESGTMSSYGTICGSGYGTTPESTKLVNCYSDSALAYEDATYHSQLAAADMKADAFVLSLNGEGSTYNKDSASINGGYPVLAWQGGTPVTPTPAADLVIKDASGMVDFAAAVAGGNTYEGKTVILDADIDLTDKTFDGIGTQTAKFAGTFDGQGHSISGIAISTSDKVEGLFASTTNTAVIKNFTANGTVTSTATQPGYTAELVGVGGIVGVNRGTVSGIISNLAVTATTALNVGGIVGFNAGLVNAYGTGQYGNAILESENGALGVVSSCVVNGKVFGYHTCGGVVGENAATIDSCLCIADVESNYQDGKNGTGGIVGRNGCNNTAYETGVVSNCAFYGNVNPHSAKWLGGIAGFSSATYGNPSATVSTIKNCYMVGSFSGANGSYTNPIVGNADDNYTNKYNNYSVTGLFASGSTEAEKGIVKAASWFTSQDAAASLSQGTRWVFAKSTDAVYSLLDAKGFASYPVPVSLTSNDATVTDTAWSGEDTVKLNYVEGQTFDMGSLKLVVNYSDGTSVQAPLTASKTDAFTLADNGSTVTVSYGDYSKQFVVSVVANEVASIALNSTYSGYTPNITVYGAGETLNLTGLKLKVTYTNGTSEVVTFTETLPEGWTTNIGNPISAEDNGKVLSLTKTMAGKATTYDTSSVEGKAVTIKVMTAPEKEGDVYLLDSADDMEWFAAQINQRGAAISGKLTADIDLSGVAYTPIGTNTAAFTGTLDGNGKTITFSDTTTFTTTQYNGVVGYLGDNGVVKNLATAGTVTLGGYSGLIASSVKGANASVTNCTNNANINNTANGYVAGIVYNVSGASVSITNCTNNGAITSTAGPADGICGAFSSTGGYLENCANSAAITGTGATGIVYSCSKGDIRQCINTGAITATGTFAAAGIVVSLTATTTPTHISACANTGAVSGKSSAAGIAGSTYKGSIFENCYNTGAITSTVASGNYGAGGLLGNYTANSKGATFTNCYSTGTVTGTHNANALIGYDTKGATLTNCYWMTGTATEAWGGTAAQSTGFTETSSDDMKAVEFVAALNGESGTAFKADGTKTQSINNGYPVLSWQTIPDPTINGGDTVETSGTYRLADGATGTITIAEGIQVIIVGKGATETFKGLNFEIGEGTTFTAKDIYAAQSSSQAKGTFDFVGNGTFKIEGTNNVDNDGGLNAAVIHVGKGYEVHFNGTGTLYGYKSALCSYIGGNAGEANGKIVFDGGYWFIKGTKTGAVIGGDSSSDKGGDIVINGGELYVKGVARGALIGGSNQGKSGDVTINGGLVELFEDFSGPAIGAGNDANAGNLTVNGGSLKTVLSSNSYNSYKSAATFNGMPSVKWDAVKATNAADYALLSFDASKYITDLSKDTVTVSIDGKQFYSGRGYTYVTNEVKNPTAAQTTGAATDTQANWLANDISWKVTIDDYPIIDPTKGTRDAYPDKSGSSFVVDTNLYFALSKDKHTVTVGEDTYTYKWDAEAGKFVEYEEPYSWYGDGTATNYTIKSAAQLVEFANIVNGTATIESATDSNAVVQDSFKGKTITLSADIDLSTVCSAELGSWIPVGNATYKYNAEAASTGYLDQTGYAFLGTFDGNGKTISNLYISTDKGYQGLFGNVGGTDSPGAAGYGVVKNFTLTGSVTNTSTTAQATDYVAAVCGLLNPGGTICDVINKANVTANNTMNVGGIVGFTGRGYDTGGAGNMKVAQANPSGENTYVLRCGNEGNITGYYKAGGIVGENACIVEYCYNSGTIQQAMSGSGGGIGGIAGRNGNRDNADNCEVGTIMYCYNSGVIKGTSPVTGSTIRGFGGITGWNNVISKVQHNYAAGVVEQGYSDYQAVIGRVDNGSGLGDNYALDTLNDKYTSTEVDKLKMGIKKSAAELKVQTYNDGDILTLLAPYFVADTTSINDGMPVLWWQNGSSVPTIASMAITTPPTTTTYTAGQTFDPAGMVLTGTYSDGNKHVISASDCTYKTDPLTVEDTAITFSYTFGGTTVTATQSITVNPAVLTSITVKTQPSYKTYAADESFDKTGMVITASYNEGAVVKTLAAEDYTVTEDRANNKVVVSYTDGGVTMTADVAVTFLTGNAPVAVEGVYELDSADDIVWFAAQANERKVVNLNAKLTADIDLSAVAYTPIGGQYAGIFDGNGKTITFGAASFDENTSQYTGVFSSVGAATIKDLTIAGSIKAQKFASAVAAQIWGNATIENCVNNASVETTAGGASGIVYSTQSSAVATIKNCVNNGAVTATGGTAAGVVNSLEAKATIENCVNNGAVNATYSYGVAGGIASTAKGIIKNCVNNGAVTATATSTTSGNAGGIAGFCSTNDLTKGIFDSYNTGAITGTGNVGGLVGSTYKLTYQNCYNTGTVSSSSASSTQGAAGLIGGYTAGAAGASLVNCYNVGTVSGAVANKAALVGYDAKGATLTNCYYLGTAETVAWGGTAAGTSGFAFKSSDEMKAAAFVTALNGESGTAFKADGAGICSINNGYPVLSWQVLPADPSIQVNGIDTKWSTMEKATAQTDWVYYKSNDPEKTNPITSFKAGTTIAPIDKVLKLASTTSVTVTFMKGETPSTREITAADGVSSDWSDTALWVNEDGQMCIAVNGAFGKLNLNDISAVSAPKVINGGDTVTESGTYYLADGATGTITIAEDISATVIGAGISGTPYKDLYFNLGNKAALTFKDVYISLGSYSESVVEFNGTGAINIEGVNVIDNSNSGNNVSVFHVVEGDDVTFGGTGTLYGYKAGSSPYIGVNMGTADTTHMGNVTFNGGTWFIKGSKMGPIIGNGDETTGTSNGLVTINAGTTMYLKHVAQGACIGASKNGTVSPDVVINGGQLEFYVDFIGASLGQGGSKAAVTGKLTVNGGSIKTPISANALTGAYGEQGSYADPIIDWKSVMMPEGNDYGLIKFDTSKYSGDITVKVDGVEYYTGSAQYGYVTNAVKNPSVAKEGGDESAKVDTQTNWLVNDSKWNLTAADYNNGTSAYPTKSGSNFAKDNALYFALSKTTHTITVGEDTYKYGWNEEQGKFVALPEDATVSYSTHVENEGWQEAVENGKVSGTSGKAYRLESIKINLDEASLEGIEGGISYRTHVQNEGWQDWVADGAESGTTGKALRLEAIQMQLTGDMADLYDVYYRVHAQNIGWMGWAKNGEEAGTEGYAYRLEAIQIVLVAKGDPAPGDVEGITSAVSYAYDSYTQGPSDPYGDELVSYNTHVQNIGWQEYSKMGGVAGTFGEALRLEGIHIKLGGAAAALNGSIEYRTHVQNIGWQTYVADGEMSGTSGKAYRLEAINIRLTDEVAAAYDVYYRVHAQNIGWMAWAKNDESAGTAGYAYRLEAIQIVLVEKGGPAPAVDYGGITSVVEDAFMEADK